MTDNQELLSTLDHLSAMKDDEISGGVVLVGSCLPVKIQAAAASAAGVIRKQSSSVSTLQYRLERAERALTRHGFEDKGAAEWKPPLGPSALPDIELFNDLHDLCVFVDSPGGPQDGAAIWEQMQKIKASWICAKGKGDGSAQRQFAALTKGFMTSNSGGPDGYCLKIQYQSLADLHAAFREMIPVFNTDEQSGIDWNYEDNAEPLGDDQEASAVPKCWCHTCRPVTLDDMRFVTCPDCGNKRCPRANDHRNACTGSNDPGADERSSLLASAKELVVRADKLCADVAARKGGRVLSTAELDEVVTVLQSIAGGVTSNPAHDARVLLGKLSGTIPGLGQSFSEGAE